MKPWTIWDDISTVLALIGLLIIAIPYLMVVFIGDTFLDIKQRIKYGHSRQRDREMYSKRL